jgi:hypothetical protein
VNTDEIVSSVLSGIVVLILASIARTVASFHHEFRRFMAEHVWLLATTLWTRDKVTKIMKRLDMPMDDPPPNDLPPERT